jgi:hypothetical protein
MATERGNFFPLRKFWGVFLKKNGGKFFCTLPPETYVVPTLYELTSSACIQNLWGLERSGTF